MIVALDIRGNVKIRRAGCWKVAIIREFCGIDSVREVSNLKGGRFGSKLRRRGLGIFARNLCLYSFYPYSRFGIREFFTHV